MWPFNRISLFWKIFMWFWAAMLVLVAVTIISFWMSRDTINFHPIDRTMKATINKAASILESDYPEKKKEKLLFRLLKSMTPSVMQSDHKHANQKEGHKKPHEDNPIEAIKPYLLYEKGAKIEDIPEPVIALWKRYKKKPHVAIHEDLVFIGPKFVKIDGKVHILFLQQHIGRFKVRMFRHFLHTISVWQLVSYLLISVLLCFALAWSITRPIKRLQSVTRRVANGESVSAKDEIGKRRDEFYWLASDFDQMSDKMLNTIESQKQLLSDVSHELRSPLTRIHLALGLLEKKLGDQESEQRDRIEKECERMEEMIAQLLNIAALERGQVFEDKQQFELCQLIKDITADAEFEATSKNVQVDLSCESNVNYEGYYSLLRSAIENIIRNAIRYTAEQSMITIRLSVEQHHATVTVCDEGEGVNAEDLPKLFDAFYRTDKARSRSEGGAGLGLAITRRSVEAHGGKVRAFNHSPNGLCVEIELPLKN